MRTTKPARIIDDLRDASRGVRLHKAMADAGVGSRRACEELIGEGRVSVNSIPIPGPPIWVDSQKDVIEVDGKPIARRPRRNPVYLLVHKTRNTICTNVDPEGRRRVFDLVPHPQRLFCVGRLDAESTGLVLLTDDGDMAQLLTHPRYGVPKTYEVSVKGQITPQAVERLNRGIWLADKTGRAAKAQAAAVQVLDRDRERTRLRITLREGRNREIRRMLARLGFRVHRLKRIALGPLKIKGLPPGGWRELTRQEVAALHAVSRSAERRATPPGAADEGKRRSGR